MKKSLWRILTVLLLLATGFGLTWAVAEYIATPPPTGEVYRPVPEWPRLPDSIDIGQVGGIGVDSHGDVFVFHRAERVWEGEEIALELIRSQTLLIMDAENGDFLDSWGADMFVMPHGLTTDSEDNVWLTDVGLHQVFKFDRAGNPLMALGQRGVPGEDSAHFNMPTDVAVAPNGSFYVSDGYRNSRILKFSPDGDYITSWGSYGTGPGEFDVPHSIVLDSPGQVYVADEAMRACKSLMKLVSSLQNGRENLWADPGPCGSVRAGTYSLLMAAIRLNSGLTAPVF